VPALGQEPLDGDADGPLVVDDEDAGANGRGSAASGSSMVNVSPLPGCCATSIRPPCPSIVRLTIASPRPVPFGFPE